MNFLFLFGGRHIDEQKYPSDKPIGPSVWSMFPLICAILIQVPILTCGIISSFSICSFGYGTRCLTYQKSFSLSCTLTDQCILLNLCSPSRLMSQLNVTSCATGGSGNSVCKTQSGVLISDFIFFFFDVLDCLQLPLSVVKSFRFST